MLSSFLDPAGRLFHPEPVVSSVPLPDGERCIVVDNVLAHPEGLVAWAESQRFAPPVGYPYPGVVHDLQPEWAARMTDLFTLRARTPLGARRTRDTTARLCLVTVPPDQLEPRQWQCHRDRIADDPRQMLFAASVLYLFRDPRLGGTSFYRPRRSMAETERMIIDSLQLDAPRFSARYGLRPGYMSSSNDWFEQVAQVPAAWNRAIFYDGGLFHSADVDEPSRLVADPQRGRLTLNSFFTCQRQAG